MHVHSSALQIRTLHQQTLTTFEWGAHAHTMATPATTTRTEAMTERVNILPSQKCSTAHTNGMISSFAICVGTAVRNDTPTPICQPFGSPVNLSHAFTLSFCLIPFNRPR